MALYLLTDSTCTQVFFVVNFKEVLKLCLENIYLGLSFQNIIEIEGILCQF